MELSKGFYSSPRWSYEILDCAMPMTFDTYSNCAHQCVYCFAFFQRSIGRAGDAYLGHKVRSVNVSKVIDMFRDPDKHAGQFAPYIKRRMTMQWGGLSDGFDWYEQKFRKSLELLRFFREIEYPISISTKGVWFLDDQEYLDVIAGARNFHWKISIITTNPAHARQIEPGTATPEERFAALHKLNGLKVGGTTLRFRPYILGTSDACVEEMFEAGKEAGADNVTTEFLCLEARANANTKARYARMSEILGYDLLEFYKENSYSGSGLLRLNYDLKRPHMERMAAIAKRVGLRFYVSDAHHKERSADANCCGCPQHAPFNKRNRGQFSEAIQIAKRKGEVRWADIQEEAEWLRGIPFGNAEGYNTGDTRTRALRQYHSMYDYMRDIWNSPRSWQSPARYFGGALVPGELDEHGDIIYIYNKPYTDEGRRVKSIPELRAACADRTGGPSITEGKRPECPVFIPSRGRSDTATIPRVFDAEGIPYTLVVEPHEYDAYAQRFPAADVLRLPESDRGVWYVRQFILEYCRENNIDWYWQFDDNIKRFVGAGKPCTATEALAYAEQLVKEYANLAMVSFDYQQYAFRQRVEYSVNRRAACAVLTWSGPGGDYIPIDPKEDVDFQLQRLAAGMSTILIHRYAMEKPPMGCGGKGGCHDMYASGKHVESAKRMLEKWPHTSPVEKPRGLDVRVDWAAFPNTLRPFLKG